MQNILKGYEFITDSPTPGGPESKAALKYPPSSFLAQGPTQTTYDSYYAITIN